MAARRPQPFPQRLEATILLTFSSGVALTFVAFKKMLDDRLALRAANWRVCWWTPTHRLYPLR